MVLQTSENFFGPSEFSYYNDMVVIDGDRALHDAYVQYVLEMKAQLRSDDRYVVVSGDDGRNTMFPSPQARGGHDRRPHGRDRLLARRVVIRAANMAFRTERAAIMRKLVELEQDGCDIEVILTNADGDILAGLVSAGIGVHPFFLRRTDTRPQVIVHDKFWLVDAKSAVTRRRRRIAARGAATGAAISNSATTCSCGSPTAACTPPTATTGS